MIEIDSIPANNERTGLPSDIMSRRRRRNDILPLLMITQHPLLTTDKSVFSPLYKIALTRPQADARYGRKVVFMTFLRHVPRNKASLLCRNVCDARHKNHVLRRCGASEHVRPREAKMPRLPGNLRLCPILLI
jgi:hypothetical protein